MVRYDAFLLKTGCSADTWTTAQGVLQSVPGLSVHLADSVPVLEATTGSDLGTYVVPFDGQPDLDTVLPAITAFRQGNGHVSVLGLASSNAAAAAVPPGYGLDEVVCLEWASAGERISRFVTDHEATIHRRAMEAFLDISLDGFWYWDVRRDHLHFSRRMLEIIGLSPAEIPTTFEQMNERIHPLDRNRMAMIRNHHMRDGTPYRQAHLRILRGDGTYGEFASSGQVVHDTLGRPILMTGSITDRTILAKVEQQLQDTQRRFSVLFHRMNDAAVLADVETGRLLEANEPAERLWGRSISQLVGMHQSQLHPPTLDAVARETFARHVEQLQRDRRGTMEMPILRSDGTEVPTEISSSLIDMNGRMLMLGVFRDITERRRAERAIRERDAQLQLSAHLASMGMLSAGIAHEINNPLTYVLGNLEVIRAHLDRCLSAHPELAAALQATTAGARHVASIVADLQVMSRAESDSQSCDPATVLRVAVRLAMSDLRHRADVETELEDGPLVSLPASALTQIALNLLSNAARSFGDRDRSLNHIRIAARSDETGVMLSFADNGRGMAPDLLQRVLDDRPDSTDRPGLGLAVCRRILNEAGGSIAIRSERGVGTTVTIRLPLAAANMPTQVPVAAPAAVAQRPTAVMIVDDDAMVADMAALFLRSIAEVSVFTDPVAALEALKQSPDAWSVVVCDLMMPQLDGCQLYDGVLALPSKPPEFLFVTGGAVTERCIAFQKQMTERGRLLLKPFDAVSLRQAVSALLARSAQP